MKENLQLMIKSTESLMQMPTLRPFSDETTGSKLLVSSVLSRLPPLLPRYIILLNMAIHIPR